MGMPIMHSQVTVAIKTLPANPCCFELGKFQAFKETFSWSGSVLIPCHSLLYVCVSLALLGDKK